MKKVKEKQTYSVLQEKTVEKYETEDGQKFISEEEAFKHEKELEKIKVLTEKYKIKTVDAEEFGVYEYSDITSCKLVYIEELNDETKEDLIYLYKYLEYSKKKLYEIKLGWNFFIETEYETCSYGRWAGYDLYIEHLNDVVAEKERELKKLMEIK